MIIDILATSVALRIGGSTLQPALQQMKNNLRSKRYA
jgi:RpiR family carbohydrate utilization transcriptional regulator